MVQRISTYLSQFLFIVTSHRAVGYLLKLCSMPYRLHFNFISFYTDDLFLCQDPEHYSILNLETLTSDLTKNLYFNFIMGVEGKMRGFCLKKKKSKVFIIHSRKPHQIPSKTKKSENNQVRITLFKTEVTE
jgi:hypothetical protein